MEFLIYACKLEVPPLFVCLCGMKTLESAALLFTAQQTAVAYPRACRTIAIHIINLVFVIAVLILQC